MHAGVRIFIIAAAVFVATIRGLAAEARPVIAFPAGAQNAPHWPQFGLGTPKDVVAVRLGMPSEVLSAQVWIYREFRTDYQDADQRGYDTLIVVFEAGRVQKMRLVNGEAVTALLDAQRRAVAAQRVATTGGALPAPSMGYK